MEETMNDSTTPRRRTARWAGAAGLLAAGAVTGGILAGTFSANAATTSTPSTSDSSTSSSSTTTEQPSATFPAHGTAAHEALEKPATGSAVSQAQAAAVKAVGSGTAGDVTTDVSGNGYEVTVTKSDGSTVEVHLDSSFTVANHGRTGG
jgi:cytoskeletal protein RodZ